MEEKAPLGQGGARGALQGCSCSARSAAHVCGGVFWKDGSRLLTGFCKGSGGQRRVAPGRVGRCIFISKVSQIDCFLFQTLLHEMIHAYLFVTNNDKDREGHGPEFCKHMHRINRLSGANITVGGAHASVVVKSVFLPSFLGSSQKRNAGENKHCP